MWELLGTPQATNIVSLVLVVVTGLYVFLTYQIAHANSKMAQHLVDQQEEMSRPIIAANIEIRSQVLLVLVIRNVGRTVASNVRMSLDRDFFRFGQTESGNLRNLSIFQKESFTLAPGDLLRFDLAQGFVIFADDADESLVPKTFEIEIEYVSLRKPYKETIAVDLKPYQMTNWPKSELALEIESLAKVLDRACRR
jgi:hypothetical protein